MTDQEFDRQELERKEARTSRDAIDDYKEMLPRYTQMFQEGTQILTVPPGTVKRIFDGGCGLGASTLAIGRAFPDSEIDACGLEDGPLDEVEAELGSRFHFHNAGIGTYLEKAQPYDLVLLARVPSNFVSSALLRRKVNKGGFVLTVDSPLDLNNRDFKPVEISNEAFGHRFMNLWRKLT